jgi:hypothetical protein
MHIQHLQTIQEQCTSNLQKCQDMEEQIKNQERLEDEITTKVNREFDYLKSIIDEQKERATNIISNLESVKEYNPPSKDFTTSTLDEMKNFQQNVTNSIQVQTKLNQSKKYLDVLKQKHLVNEVERQM